MQKLLIDLQHLHAGFPQTGYRFGFAAAACRQQAVAAVLQNIRLKTFQCILLLNLPVQLTGGDAVQRMQHRLQVDVSTCEARCDLLLRFEFSVGIDHSTQILLLDAAFLIILPVLVRRFIAIGPGELMHGFQSIGKYQVLKTMQGIVVYKILDRRLSGQHMFEMLDQMLQPGSNILLFVSMLHGVGFRF